LNNGLVIAPMKAKFILVVLALLLPVSSIVAQQDISNVSKRGTTAAPFLTIGQGARALSMGSAFVAVADDQSAMYWNPAGIAALPGNGFLFDHTQWIAGIQYNYLGATISIGNYGVVGLNYTSSNIADMTVTTVDSPEGTGEVFGVTNAVFGVSYALKLTDKFSIGFNPKMVYQKIWKMTATALAVDMGVKYETPFKGITLGMAITNFGEKMRLDGNSTLVLYDPDPNTTGNNGRIPANYQTDRWALPLNFKVGIAYRAIETETHVLILAVDASHPSDNFESVDLGGEYVFNDFFALRGGYKSLFLKDSEETFTLGAGVKQYVMGNTQFKIDYAYQAFGRLGNIQKFCLGITF
ncbi:MAG: PorV/PorQ family protein, partial [Ignavibacteriales bacterium]|nr:PorV/PorQ family protein [Ignavibacteriales bacterium]